MREGRPRIIAYFLKNCEDSVCSRTEIISFLTGNSRSKVINSLPLDNRIFEQEDPHENKTTSAEVQKESGKI